MSSDSSDGGHTIDSGYYPLFCYYPHFAQKIAQDALEHLLQSKFTIVNDALRPPTLPLTALWVYTKRVLLWTNAGNY